MPDVSLSIKDENKTKEQLINELIKLRKQIIELEASEIGHKLAEEQIALARKEWELTFDAVPDLITILDNQNRIIRVNKAMAERLGINKEDVIGLSCYDFIHGKDKSTSFCPNVQLLSDGQQHTAEVYMERLGGDFLVSVSPIHDANDNMIGSVHIARDLTERKQMEKAIQDSEEKFRKISATAQDAIIMMDHEGNISYWNLVAEKIFGYREEEAVGKYLHKLIVPDRYYRNFLKGFQRFKDTGEGAAIGKRLELSAIKKDGIEFSIELSLSSVKIKGQWNAIGIVRDVTKRKKAENKIRQDFHMQSVINAILQISLEPISIEEQLERILDLLFSIPWLSIQSKGCIYLVEDEENVLTMKAMRKFPKIHQELCAKVTFGKCLCGQAASTGEIIFTNHIDNSHEIRYEGIVPHGHYCVPIMSGDHIFGVINLYVKEGHSRDKEEENFLSSVANTLAGIIERKKAEEELNRYHEHLEELVKERTESINKQREIFISVLIHDLKGPLVPVLGYIRRLINGKVKSKEDVQRIYKVLQDASQELMQTIEHTSKDLKGKSALLSFHPEETTFNDTLIPTVMKYLPEMEDRGIEIVINNQRREQWNDLEKVNLKADPSQLKTLIENLLGNSTKYAKSKVEMELQQTDSYIRFVVSDDGCGIPEQYHEKIFEEYFQVPESEKGTGLGLYSVNKVVENHKGKIVVHSALHKGTTFEIILPF